MNRSRHDAIVDQAFAQFRAGAIDVAEQQLTALVQEQPNHGNAHALLGEIAAARSDHARAIALHQRAIRIDPKAARYQCYLASALAADGRFRDAIAHYERALKIREQFPLAIGGLAQVLSMRGRHDQAAALLKPFLKSGNLTARMLAVQTRLLYSHKDDAAVVAFVNDHDRDDLDLGPRRDMLCTMGRSLERQQQFDAAFDAFSRANDIATVSFDPEGMRERMEALATTFDRAALESSPRASNSSDLPVFIVGMPRSGSTLVEQIIHAHPRGHGAGEIADLNRALAQMYLQHLESGEENATTSAEQFDTIAHGYLQALKKYGRSAHRVVDKHLGNYQHLGIISLLFPNARIIHTRRHPIDTGLSCFKHPLLPFVHPWSTKLEWIGSQYAQYDRLMQHWESVIDHPILHVDYEALVQEPERVTREIIEFCGLPWDDRCLRFYDARRDVTTISFDQVTQPVYSSAVGLWHSYEGHLGPMIDALGPLAHRAHPQSAS
ncbi:MAG: sulfotransferase [Planctomycetota bacterium]